MLKFGQGMRVTTTAPAEKHSGVWPQAFRTYAIPVVGKLDKNRWSSVLEHVSTWETIS